MTLAKSPRRAGAWTGWPLRPLLLCALAAACCPASGADDFLYTVQSGDHPWNIAQRFLKDPSYGGQLKQLNRIGNDRRLSPGTQLRIPAEWLRLRALRVRLLAVHGDTVVIPGAGAGRAAIAGDELLPGTLLRTGPQASATLEFEDGSRVLVRRDSELRLVRSSQALIHAGALVEIDLLRGALENVVKPVANPSGRFEIRAPAAIAAVRGTQFRVSATDTHSRTEVLEGGVLVANPAGQSATGAGLGTLAALGRAPDPPTPLLAAPDLSTLPERFERLPIDWPLPAVAGAAGYRTQFAPDDRFSLLVLDEVAAAPRARALDIADGSYVLRMRAIDAKGLEGLSAERALVVHARPEPPLLIEPAPDAVTVSERPTFRWSRANAAWHYRLEITPADASTGTTPLQKTVTPADGATIQVELPVGVHSWRVASVDPARGRQGPWGDRQSFRRVLPGPGVEPPQVAAGSVTLRWSAQPRVSNYRLQVAGDDTFGQLLADVRPTAPQHQLEHLVAGTYHIRVQSTGEDGYVGPWGTVQSFTVPPEPPQYWKALLILLPFLLAL